MADYLIEFDTNARATDVSDHSRGVLKDVMETAGVFRVLISSTARGPYDQARVMYDNIKSKGVAHQKKLYAKAGDKVIDAYVTAKAAGKNRTEIIAAMEAKVIEVGPRRVSNHAADLTKMNVFDVAPSSIPSDRKTEWEKAIKANADIGKYIFPPGDPGYHFEIPQPQS